MDTWIIYYVNDPGYSRISSKEVQANDIACAIQVAGLNTQAIVCIKLKVAAGTVVFGF